jgi:hypothetical protein
MQGVYRSNCSGNRGAFNVNIALRRPWIYVYMKNTSMLVAFFNNIIANFLNKVKIRYLFDPRVEMIKFSPNPTEAVFRWPGQTYSRARSIEWRLVG